MKIVRLKDGGFATLREGIIKTLLDSVSTVLAFFVEGQIPYLKIGIIRVSFYDSPNGIFAGLLWA